MTTLRLGTRASRLALVQSELVVAALREARPDIDIEVVTIASEGDRDKTTPLTSGQGTGWFTSALQDALRAGEVDFLVHSYKDLPTARPEGLVIAAVPPRADPRDVLVTADGRGLDALVPGSVVGTSSPRRETQLRALRPDLVFQPIRGNVETRISRVDQGEYAATVLALAGLTRLGLEAQAAHIFAPEEMLPAPAQGAMAVECRAADEDVCAILASVDDAATRQVVECERAFLQELEAGCSFPAGAYASVEDGAIRLSALAAWDGQITRAQLTGDDGVIVGRVAAQEILARAGQRS